MKVAVVTGASRGIGASLAKKLVGDGWHVFLLARNQYKLGLLSDELREKGHDVHFEVCDVTSQDQVNQAVQKAISLWGQIDLLVANAGISHRMDIDDFSTRIINDIIDVNIKGVVYSISACLPKMMAQKNGHIVVISSIAAFQSFGGSYPYCASKAYINSFCEGLRNDLLKSNIDVSVVCPGFVRTAMTSKNRFFMPFLLDVDKASSLIHKAILAKKKLYVFPWQMSLIVKIRNFFPRRLIRMVTKR